LNTQLFSRRWLLLSLLGLILASGFVGVNLANYYVSSGSVRDALINNELPLTSNNIYSEIQAGLLRPIYISSLMAHDTFLKDWMLAGEKDVPQISRYLTEIKKRYSVSSTFVVSNKSNRYYYGKGVLKTISPNVPKDSWFFTMEAYPKDYRVDVDYNEAKKNTLTIFVNHKLYDYNGHFLGVTGLGLDVTQVGELIEQYMQDYNRNIFFVDRQGVVKSHHNSALVDKVSIRTLPGISAVADTLLKGKRGFLRYETDKDVFLLSYRYIPELDWFLIVEQPESVALQPIRHALYINLGISVAVTLLVLLLSGYTINLFQSRLESMARTDKLTGLANRQYFDVVFDYSIKSAERHRNLLSLVVFDVDDLKNINDRYGHLEGDRILAEVARMAREGVRRSDVVARWGGDEFTILFLDCDETVAGDLMDAIRQSIKTSLFVSETDTPVTISAGVVQFRGGDNPDTTESLLARADAQLYFAKRKGRDNVSRESC